MTAATLQLKIEEAVPELLVMAKELTRNKISDNCKYILTEIKDSQENFDVQRQLLIAENDKKTPAALEVHMPALKNLYDNLHDINLHVYRAAKEVTVIDIRYYPKSSLDQDYRQKVLNNPPMLHCKVAMPPWLSDKNEKFDTNWEHRQWLINWKLFWFRRQLRHHKRLQ